MEAWATKNAAIAEGLGHLEESTHIRWMSRNFFPLDLPEIVQYRVAGD